jgi:serine acetyltransferase
METRTVFDKHYAERKAPLLAGLIDQLRAIYTSEQLQALRVDPISRGVLAQPSGRGFVNRDILETVLGNLLECVAPGSHNATESQGTPDLADLIEEVADQVYAMILQSFRAATENGADNVSCALAATFGLLSELPRLKQRALWNRFASLKDPAVWDAHAVHAEGISYESLAKVDFVTAVDRAIEDRQMEIYTDFLKAAGLGNAFPRLMQLVTSTYPGWRVLFYHDVAHALTRSGSSDSANGLERVPVPLLPRAISELGGRYYQVDVHPETQIGDANFLEHPHRGITTGQTGIIGSGCVLYPCTLGGITDRVRQRHPELGDFVMIGTDATLLGPVKIGQRSNIGPGSDIYGYVEMGEDCGIASSVVIGTVKTAGKTPGTIHLGNQVRVGDGTIVENSTELNLVIPDKAVIPARSHVVNDGFGNPRFVHE